VWKIVLHVLLGRTSQGLECLTSQIAFCVQLALIVLEQANLMLLSALNAVQENTKLALVCHHRQTASSVLQEHMAQALAIQQWIIALSVELDSTALLWAQRMPTPAPSALLGRTRLGLAAVYAICAQLGSIRLAVGWWHLKTAAFVGLGHFILWQKLVLPANAHYAMLGRTRLEF
jgi:hypothetical protein